MNCSVRHCYFCYSPISPAPLNTLDIYLVPRLERRSRESTLSRDTPQQRITPLKSIVLVALCAEYIVSAIETLAEDLSEELIGQILLPIVGKAADLGIGFYCGIKGSGLITTRRGITGRYLPAPQSFDS